MHGGGAQAHGRAKNRKPTGGQARHRRARLRPHAHGLVRHILDQCSALQPRGQTHPEPQRRLCAALKPAGNRRPLGKGAIGNSVHRHLGSRRIHPNQRAAAGLVAPRRRHKIDALKRQRSLVAYRLTGGRQAGRQAYSAILPWRLFTPSGAWRAACVSGRHPSAHMPAAAACGATRNAQAAASIASRNTPYGCAPTMVCSSPPGPTMMNVGVPSTPCLMASFVLYSTLSRCLPDPRHSSN